MWAKSRDLNSWLWEAVLGTAARYSPNPTANLGTCAAAKAGFGNSDSPNKQKENQELSAGLGDSVEEQH